MAKIIETNDFSLIIRFENFFKVVVNPMGGFEFGVIALNRRNEIPTNIPGYEDRLRSIRKDRDKRLLFRSGTELADFIYQVSKMDMKDSL